MNKNVSGQRRKYLRDIKVRNTTVMLLRALVLVLFFALWEIAAVLGWIDSFIMSQPSRMLQSFVNMTGQDLWLHIYTTCFETITGFLMGIVFGIVIAALLWWFEMLSAVSDPYLVVLNALPKIALGPVIIIIVGANERAIIFMALAISLVVTVLQMENGFKNTNPQTIKMLKSFGASKWQIYSKIVFPSNLPTLFNSMKINIGLSLVGVIAGEFLVSKAGLGYLIVYGGQVFKMDLVMMSVFILSILAALLYVLIVAAEKLTFMYINRM